MKIVNVTNDPTIGRDLVSKKAKIMGKPVTAGSIIVDQNNEPIIIFGRFNDKHDDIKKYLPKLPYQNNERVTRQNNDWDFSARLIEAGYKTGRTNLTSFDHKMKSMTGGAEEIYKKKESVKEAAHIVADRYKHAAKVVYNEDHGLHEVRFNWKKLKPKT